jgi:hypothetical protein
MKVYFFGSDEQFVALVPENAEPMTLTIGQAMKAVKILSTGEGVSVFTYNKHIGQAITITYDWGTPNLAQAIIGDQRQNIYNHFKNQNA